jgi:hypothetical protein
VGPIGTGRGAPGSTNDDAEIIFHGDAGVRAREREKLRAITPERLVERWSPFRRYGSGFCDAP